MGVRKDHAVLGARQLAAYFRTKSKVLTLEEYRIATDAPIGMSYLVKWFKSYDLALDWVRKVDPRIFIDLTPAPKAAPKAAPKPKPAPKAKVKKNDE